MFKLLSAKVSELLDRPAFALPLCMFLVTTGVTYMMRVASDLNDQTTATHRDLETTTASLAAARAGLAEVRRQIRAETPAPIPTAVDRLASFSGEDLPRGATVTVVEDQPFTEPADV